MLTCGTAGCCLGKYDGVPLLSLSADLCSVECSEEGSEREVIYTALQLHDSTCLTVACVKRCVGFRAMFSDAVAVYNARVLCAPSTALHYTRVVQYSAHQYVHDGAVSVLHESLLWCAVVHFIVTQMLNPKASPIVRNHICRCVTLLCAPQHTINHLHFAHAVLIRRCKPLAAVWHRCGGRQCAWAVEWSH